MECTRYTSVTALQDRVSREKSAGKRVGLLATMGALHEGHLTLARNLSSHCDVRVASVFVNPTQFNDPKDYQAYVINVDRDQELLQSAGVEILFAPSAEEVYPPGFQTQITPGHLAAPLEGEFRPGHFAGMATVVTLLLAMVQPDVTIFGEKDFQQLRIVEQLVKDLRLPVEVLRGTLVRERDGLAMSSRNARLSPESRRHALAISRGLMLAKEALASGRRQARDLEGIVREEVQQIPDHVVDYISVRDEETLQPVESVTTRARLLVVVRVQGVRLLDNVALQVG